MNVYTAQQVSSALAALEVHGGNIRRTARDVGMPPSTLRLWRDSALAHTPAHSVPEKVHDFAVLWADKEAEVLERIGELVPSASFRDLSIFAGIAADKHLDYSQGRKGAVSIGADGAATTLNVQVNYYGRQNAE